MKSAATIPSPFLAFASSILFTPTIKRLLAIVFLGLLALILFLVWPNSGAGKSSGDNNQRNRSGAAYTPAETDPGSRPGKAPGKSQRTKPDDQVYAEPTHSLAQLKSFYLDRLQSDGCTLYEALEMASEAYYRVSTETSEVAHRLSFKFEGKPQGAISFELSGKPFWQAINHLAALGGMRVAERGPPIVLAEVQDDGTNISRTFAVPPTFAAEISNPLNIPDDPFSDPAPPPSIEATLRETGILLSSDSSVTYDPATSRLTISAPTRDINRVGSLTEVTLDPPVLFQMSAQIINAPAGTTVPNDVYSRERADEIINNLMDSQGGSLVSNPVVTTRPGQSGRIEMGASVPTGSGDNEFVGRSIELLSSPIGFQLRAHIEAVSSELLDNGEIAAQELTTSAVLPRGSSYIIQSERPGGGTQFLVYTPTEIDPAGVPVPAPGALPTPTIVPLQAIPRPTP